MPCEFVEEHDDQRVTRDQRKFHHSMSMYAATSRPYRSTRLDTRSSPEWAARSCRAGCRTFSSPHSHPSLHLRPVSEIRQLAIVVDRHRGVIRRIFPLPANSPVTSPSRTLESCRRQRRKDQRFVGCHSSIFVPSGSRIQPNLPFGSESSRLRIVTPFAFRRVRNASRSSTAK